MWFFFSGCLSKLCKTTFLVYFVCALFSTLNTTSVAVEAEITATIASLKQGHSKTGVKKALGCDFVSEKETRGKSFENIALLYTV